MSAGPPAGRASRDGLTGLLNRTTFEEQAGREVRRQHAAGSVPTLIIADLDNFKAINDTHGHAAGDAAIQAFADACRSSIRHTDLAGRYGGEEFIILLPGRTRKAPGSSPRPSTTTSPRRHPRRVSLSRP